MNDHELFLQKNDSGKARWLYSRIVELEQKYEQVKSENVRLCSLVAKFEEKYNEENTCRIAELEVMVEQNNRISEVERKIDFIDTEYIHIGNQTYRVDTKKVSFCCSHAKCIAQNPSGRCNGNPYKLHTLVNLEILSIGANSCSYAIETISNKNVKYISLSMVSPFIDLHKFPSCHTLTYSAHTTHDSNTIPILVSSLSMYKHRITRIVISDSVNEDRTILKNYCKMNNIALYGNGIWETIRREQDAIMNV